MVNKRLLLPRCLLGRSRENRNCLELIQTAAYCLLFVLPAHPRRVVDKGSLPERVCAARRLRNETGAGRHRSLLLLLWCRLGRKVPGKRVGARLQRLERSCYQLWLLLLLLLRGRGLERRVGVWGCKRLGSLRRGPGKGIG